MMMRRMMKLCSKNGMMVVVGRSSFSSTALCHRSWSSFVSVNRTTTITQPVWGNNNRIRMADDPADASRSLTMMNLHLLQNRPQPQQQPQQQQQHLQYRWISNDSSGGGGDSTGSNRRTKKEEEKDNDKFVMNEPALKSTRDDEVYEEELDYAFNTEKIAQRIDRTKFTVPVPVKMPDVGHPTSKIKKWFQSPGDIILYQTTLADIETPEFTFGFQTEHEDVGILSEILVAEDVQVPVGTPICIVLHQPEDDPDLDPDLEPIDDYSDEAQAQRRERIAKKSAARKQGRDYEE